MYVLIPYLFLAIFLILHIHGGPLTLYMKLPVSSCCSFSAASLISSFSSSLCLTFRSCFITTLLNGLSASLILFKFRNIFVSLFLHPLLLVMVFHCFLLLFLILLPFLHLSILQMFLHSPTIFWISSSFWSLVQVCLTLGVHKLLYSFFCSVFLFLQYICPSVTFGLLPPLLCLCQL